MITNRVIKLLSEVIGMEEVDLSASTELTPEYGIEPIDVAKLVIMCEERFDVTIHDEDVHTFRTVKDLTEYIENILSEY